MSAPERVLRPVGDTGWMVDCADLADAVGVQAALQADGWTTTGGAATVLVQGVTRSALQAALREIPRGSLADQAGREIEIPVVYDGEDLSELARELGVSEQALIAWHSERPWVAAFAGFAPGFLYCARPEEGPTTTGAAGAGELPQALRGQPQIPRRSSPRSAVPTGSVAVAGAFAAVYPRSSPGGWQLLGRTSERLVDLTAQSPSLLRPGDRVLYRPVREQIALTSADADDGMTESAPADPSADALIVEQPGLRALVEDRGRPGLAHLGISSSGAADRAGMERAQHLVGNPPQAAGLELLLGGAALRARGELVLAVTGARVPLRITGGENGAWSPRCDLPFALRHDQTLTVGAPEQGLRVNVAVRGGLDLPQVLGSAAADTLSGLGPQQLEAGQELAVGRDPGTAVDWPLEVAGAPASSSGQEGPLVIRAVAGPRDDWFTPAALRSLQEQQWRAGATSDRVGVRLEGEPLERDRTEELPSEGTVPGSIQVPASGLPVIFLRDHPVTGGYPVIATVLRADLDLVAQAEPGRALRIELIDPAGVAEGEQ